jgi:membrane protease YdiL (CAAX protease family)
MISTYFRESTPGMKLLLTLLFCAIGLLTFLLLGMAIVLAFYGSAVLTSIANPDSSIPGAINALKIVQICQNIGLFVIPGFLLSFYFSSKPMNYLGFNKISFNLGFLTFLIAIFAFPAINLLSSINEQIALPDQLTNLEDKAEILTKAFMQVNGIGGILVNVFMIAVLPALGEELIFRGIFQKLFAELTGKTIWGILISAAIFSGMHLQFQGFIPRFALGVLFGYMLVWSGSIWIPILAHFINNLTIVIAYPLIFKGSIPAETENVGGLTTMWPIGLISLGIVLLLMWKIRSEGLMIRKIEQTALE